MKRKGNTSKMISESTYSDSDSEQNKDNQDEEEDEFGNMFDMKYTESQVLSVCSALGSLELVNTNAIANNKVIDEDNDESTVNAPILEGEGDIVEQYVPGDDVAGCLRDLKRMLRDDEKSKNHQIFKWLGKWQILQKDLIPILIYADKHDNNKLSLAVIELLIPLTWTFDYKTAGYVDILDYLRSYKEAFIQQPEIFNAIMKQMIIALTRIHSGMGTLNVKSYMAKEYFRATSVVGLILTFIRNILAIKDIEAPITASTNHYFRSTLQERLIILLDKYDYVDLMISFSSSLSNNLYQQWSGLILEIVYHFLVTRNIDQIWDSYLSSSSKSKVYSNGDDSAVTSSEYAILTNNKSLKNKLLNEQKLKQQNQNQNVLKSRHSRFGGSLSFKLASGSKFNVHNPSLGIKSIKTAMDVNKKVGPYGRFKQPTIEDYFKDQQTKIPKSIDVYTKFCTNFLNESFSVFCKCIKRMIDLELKVINDKMRIKFIWIVSFFLQFNLIYLKQKHNMMLNLQSKTRSLKLIINEINNDKGDKLRDARIYVNEIEELNSKIEILNSLKTLHQLSTVISSQFVNWLATQMPSQAEEKNSLMLCIFMQCFKELLITIDYMLQSNIPSVEAAKIKIQATGDKIVLDEDKNKNKNSDKLDEITLEVINGIIKQGHTDDNLWSVEIGEELRSVAQNIQMNLFYISDTRIMLLHLSKSYKPAIGLPFLMNLVETVHIFLNLLNLYVKESKSIAFSKEKVRKKNKKRKLVISNFTDENDDTNKNEKDENEVTGEDNAVENSENENDVKIEKMDLENANVDKTLDVNKENEDRGDGQESENESDTNGKKKEKRTIEVEVDSDYDYDYDFEEEKSTYKEKEIDFESIEKSYACTNVILTYSLLLKHYEIIESKYLWYIITMYHRIAVKCKMEYMFYQLSILNIFHEIIQNEDKLPSKNNLNKELIQFIKYITCNFFNDARKENILLIEALFPKSIRL